jgi:hypothetical protein
MLMDKVRDIPIENWNREARYRFLQQLLGKATTVKEPKRFTSVDLEHDTSHTNGQQHESTSSGTSASAGFDKWIESIGAAPSVQCAADCSREIELPVCLA